MFTGHFFHRATGLYLAPYRAYDPQLGRWLSREPLGLDGPNLYHYAFGNTIGLIDPNGLAAVYFGGSGEITFGAGGSAGYGYVLDFSNPLDSGVYGTASITGGVQSGVGYVGGFSWNGFYDCI